MSVTDTYAEEQAAILGHPGAILVSLELSRKSWLVTSLLPGAVEKMSRHSLVAGETGRLLSLLAALKAKARARTGLEHRLVCIQEAGYDGFWLHRVLQGEGMESHVVDPGSVAVPRRRRRAKSDRLDGEMLLRTLAAYLRREPRVCAMARPPSPDDEDRRQVSRERSRLAGERTRHVNRIKGLLIAQGIRDYEPLRRDARRRLEALVTGDGRPLPEHLGLRIRRELDVLDLLQAQIRQTEAERDDRGCQIVCVSAAAGPNLEMEGFAYEDDQAGDFGRAAFWGVQPRGADG